MNGAYCTFLSLLARVGRVEIPLLQRDYAQGRNDTRTQAIRDRFVASLARTLLAPEPRSLDLDFVYGRMRPGESQQQTNVGVETTRRLEPIDGQQRLTTLLLLHWYAACVDGRLRELRNAMWVEGVGSGFSYRTRPAARKFLDALIDHSREDAGWTPAAGMRPSAWIEDQSWFTTTWQRDPTVEGCLRMLDTVHASFRAAPGVYDRLTSPEAPRVRFRLLELEGFQLADDLYLKMNARGKALTPFEVFKAQLEASTAAVLGDSPAPNGKSMSWRHYLETRIDGKWTDLLWKQRRADPGGLDDRFMHLIRAVALVAVDVGKATEKTEAASARAAQSLEHLVENPQPTFAELEQHGLVGRRFFEVLTSLVDTLATDPNAPAFMGRVDFLDEKALFDRVLRDERITYVDWVELRAWCAFLLAVPSSPADEACRHVLHDWMRLVSNLAENSDIDDLDRFLAALRGVSNAAKHAAGPELLASVADGSVSFEGFSKTQRTQEQIKAALILKDARWRELLEKAEAHRYFRGDVGFLLSFSGVHAAWQRGGGCTWKLPEDDRLRAAFAKWHERASAIFPDEEKIDTGRFAEHLWERALLATGNYLWPARSNWSLLDGTKGESSWKRLLREVPDGDAEAATRRDVVRRVLERVDPGNTQGSLQAIIDDGVQGEDDHGWRALLVGEPRHVAFCGKRMLRFCDDRVLLLTRLRRNGRHTDLHLHELFLRLTDRDGLAGWEFAPPFVEDAAATVRIVASRKRPSLQVSVEWSGDVLAVTVVLTGRMKALGESLGRGWKAQGDGGSWTRTAPSVDRAEAFVMAVARLAET